tara:strand:- start:766 stop:1098 length:333 start_codon:yes stop_codon:yes gene_type:complete
MLSFGWSEIALVVIVVVIVVGPKELPNLIKNLGNFSKSLKKASRQFKRSLNELSEEGDLKDIKKSISEFKDIKNNLDPTKNIKEELSTIKETVIFTDKEISKINNKIKND